MAAPHIFSDIISEIRNKMNFLPPVSGYKNDSIIENIKCHLSAIEGVVPKQSDSNEIVVARLDENDSKTRDWVGKVTDELTNLFYLLDDLHLHVDAATPLSRQSVIASIFSVCNLTPPRSPLILQLKQIEMQLCDVAADASNLSVKSIKNATNFSDAKYQGVEIVGRKKEKEDYVRILLAGEKDRGDVPLIVITGIQGIGKTRLAKSVWDDERVKSAFDLMVWIDGIHDKFYAEFVVKSIIHESAMKKNKLEEKEKDYDYHSVVMDQYISVNNLGDALRGTRFFLVLDDLRNEDSEEWHKLLHMLREAPAGGAVVITTQSDIVAKLVFPHCKQLWGMRKEDSWSLFEQVVGGRCSKDSKIIEAQKKMVMMCRGVPAAIITMARLVSSREAKEESEICQLKEFFMREMMMRYYNNLPSLRLKQCFAYCSFILSKVSYVRVETLIRFWLAEGFLGPVNSSALQQPEDLGLDCIQELCRRSIFSSEENDCGIISKCSMNDYLMQDLAAFVAGDDIIRMEDPDKDVNERVHRVLLTSKLDVSNGIPKSLNNKNLRTILLSPPPSLVPNEVVLSWSACNAIFCGFKRLRVLTLRNLGMKVLPDSIAELKSLRYLSLVRNNLKKLPSAIGELKHLLTLVLSECHELKELPNEMKDLVSLRHLALEGCLHLKRMPSGLKQLTCLQTLSHFVASTNKKKSYRGGLWELISLNNLRGQLEILHLERLQFIESDKDSGRAYLREKEHLQSLTLRWNHDDESGKHSKEDKISLANLEPHPNLQGLSIIGYEGEEFSDWLLSKFINLVKFSLYNCSKCKKLPPLDQLPKLKVLELQRLDSLEFIIDDHDNELEVAENTLFFPSLKKLEISDCPNLKSWWKGRINNNAVFPCLSKLEVNHCPKLDCMPLYPDVDDELFLRCSNLKPLLETLKHGPPNSRYSPPLSKLKDLRIEIVEQEQPPLPEEWLKSFTSLKKLSIECKGLKSFMKGSKYPGSLQELYIKKYTEVYLPRDEWKGLINLVKLFIMEFPQLKSLPEGIKNLTSLKHLRIDSCPELESLPEGIGHLTSLTSLSIEECQKLASLPQEMVNLTSLQNLHITNCPILFPRCQKETGDDWPHIKHIKNFKLFDTSEYYD